MNFKIALVLSVSAMLALPQPASAAGLRCQDKKWTFLCGFTQVKPADAEAEKDAFVDQIHDRQEAIKGAMLALDAEFQRIQSELRGLLAVSTHQKARASFEDLIKQVTESHKSRQAQLVNYMLWTGEMSPYMERLQKILEFLTAAEQGLSGIPASNVEGRKAALYHFAESYARLAKHWDEGREFLEKALERVAKYDAAKTIGVEFRYFDMDVEDCFLYAAYHREDARMMLYSSDWVRAIIDPKLGPMKLECSEGWNFADAFRDPNYNFKYNAKRHRGVSIYESRQVSMGTWGSMSGTAYNHVYLHQIIDDVVKARGTGSAQAK